MDGSPGKISSYRCEFIKYSYTDIMWYTVGLKNVFMCAYCVHTIIYVYINYIHSEYYIIL